MRALFSFLTLLLAGSLTVLAPRPALAQGVAPATFSGKVVSVIDGDTLGVLRGGKEAKVRLHGIDAPAIGQKFGPEARQFAREQVLGKIVTVQITDVDRDGRLVGIVTLGSAPSLNEALVKDGLAWHHQSGARDRNLAAAENGARVARRGLWKDAHPTPPWVRRGAMVFVVQGGTSYHRAGCRFLKHPVSVSRDAVKARRLTACKACRP